MRDRQRAIRFCRALATGATAQRTQGASTYAVPGDGGRRATLDAVTVERLAADGVLDATADRCSAGAGIRTWLRRQLSTTDEYAGQHRTLIRAADGTAINLSESPLARLAAAADGEAPFLGPHHVEAGERVRRLVERAHLQPRMTIAYDAARTAGGRADAAEISDLAADARRELAQLQRLLPRDCAGVVIDVCGLLKGLQVVESERGWPRRTARLVLRMGLDQIARLNGIDEAAVGPQSRRTRAWLGDDARPKTFG